MRGLFEKPRNRVDGQVFDELTLGGVGLLTAGRGWNRDRADAFLRALRAGVEAADALDFVAEKVESIRLLRIVGIDVEQAAAGGELSGVLAERFGVVVELASELCRPVHQRHAASPVRSFSWRLSNCVRLGAGAEERFRRGDDETGAFARPQQRA